MPDTQKDEKKYLVAFTGPQLEAASSLIAIGLITAQGGPKDVIDARAAISALLYVRTYGKTAGDVAHIIGDAGLEMGKDIDPEGYARVVQKFDDDVRKHRGLPQQE